MNQTLLGRYDSIALDAIHASPTNPRRNFPAAALEEMARSIRELGVNTPVLLRTWPAGAPQYNGAGELRTGRLAEFELVSGERRCRAAAIAGLAAVPATIRELSDVEVREIQLVENLQRSDLHPVEEAAGYRALLHVGAAAEDIAKMTGKTLAYVKQRMQLLALDPLPAAIFGEGHLTLGHALMLARLTPRDQERALLYLLGIRDWEIDKSISTGENISRRLQEKVSGSESVGLRVVNGTEAQLKDWIASHILLELRGVPWDLADAKLLPAAGACTTCPKRSGANAALFSGLTEEDDICFDPACFDAKRSAFVQLTQAAAKESGSPLLKLSSKPGNEKMEKSAVEMKPGPLAGKPGAMRETKKAVVVSAKALKQGQWVPSLKDGCPATVMGLVMDGPEKGKTRFACPDQRCKVHHHQVASPGGNRSGNVASLNANSTEGRTLAAEQELYEKQEAVVRRGVFAAIIEGGKIDSLATLRRLVKDAYESQWDIDSLAIVDLLGISASESGDEGAAQATVLKFIASAREPELFTLSWIVLNCELLSPGRWARQPHERNLLQKLAEAHGVDAKAAIAKIEAPAETKPEPEAKPKKKLDAKAQAKRKAEAAKRSAFLTEEDDIRKAAGARFVSSRTATALAAALGNAPLLDRKSQSAGERSEAEASDGR